MALASSATIEQPVESSGFSCAPKFPAIRLTSHGKFLQFLSDSREMREDRISYEQSVATAKPSIVQEGTCAPCLKVAAFTSPTEGGHVLEDGRIVPNWREAMLCNCKDRLSNRHRAMLHFMQASGIPPRTRLLFLTLPSALDSRLPAMVDEIVHARPFLPLTEVSSFDFALSDDYLHFVPQLDAALARLCAGLKDGGKFIFTVPFHCHEAKSEMLDMARFGEDVPAECFDAPHKLGWDLLDKLRTAGFRDAAAYLYWSGELGYFGPMNFIFRAVK